MPDAKGGFLWGSDVDVGGWETAQTEPFIDVHEGFLTNVTGRVHTFREFISPTDYWERQRSYISFNTSGYQAAGWCEIATLKLYMTDGRSLKENGQTFQQFSPETDWLIELYTVSGAINRNASYSATYGFGNDLSYPDWGSSPHSNINNLSEKVSSLSFQQMHDNFTGGTVEYVGTIPTRIQNRWIEFNIPIDYLNTIGETHFRIVHNKEVQNMTPSGGTFNHHEYIIYHTGENTNPPELHICYVIPAEYPMSNLRLCDLSVQRVLQRHMNNDIILSGVEIKDGYPQDILEFSKNQNVSLEHLDTISQPIEIFGNNALDTRRFALDIVCKDRSDALEIESKLKKRLHGNIDFYDFRYGFINPKPRGKIYLTNVDSFSVYDELFTDREMNHTVITFDAVTLTSG